MWRKRGVGQKALTELRKEGLEVKNYLLVDLSHACCEVAKDNLSEFSEASVLEQDIMRTDFATLTAAQQPQIIIASGALEIQDLNDPQDAKFVLKKLITVMPNGGMIYLTGFQNQHNSLSEIQKIYPFKVLKKVDALGNEFLVLQKVELDLPFKIKKDGILDLFYIFHKYPDISLEQIFKDNEDKLADIRILDLSLCPLKNEDMAALALLPNLKILRLNGVANINDLLPLIPSEILQKLKVLDLSFTEIREGTIRTALIDSQLTQLQLDQCGELDVQVQIQLMFEYGQKRDTLHLGFIRRLSYTRYTGQVIDILRNSSFASQHPYKKIVIPTSAACSQLQLAVLALAKRDFTSVVILQDHSYQEAADKTKGLLEQLKNTQVDTKTGIYSHEFEAIWQYVQQNAPAILQDVKERNIPMVIKKEDSKLSRTLQFNPNGHVYILLKTKNVPLVGNGEVKKVKFAYDFTDSKYVASYTIAKNKERFIENLEIVFRNQQERQIRGLVKILSCFSITSHKRKAGKIQVLTEHHAKGNLRDALDTLDNQRKKSICRDIFAGVHFLHQLGLAHLDIHSGNVLLNDEGRGVLGDFDSLLKIGEPQVRTAPLNRILSAPEILEQFSSNPGSLTVTEKADVWMMGCMLAEIFNTDVSSIASFQRGNFTDLQQLIWSMKRTDPAERISLSDARKRFREIDVSALVIQSIRPLQPHSYITEVSQVFRDDLAGFRTDLPEKMDESQ